nr:protein MLP1 isoform X2 [Halyomorpha halys]
MKFQITFLGANSLFGRVASALLSRTPSVKTLKLYDELEKPLQGSEGEPTCVVQWHRGKAELTVALEGSDIVVIGDDSKVISTNEKDALMSSASKVVDFVYAVAKTTPKAMVVVAASPLNLMVPLAGYVLKEMDCYDGRKLLGVTSVDTLRANAIYSEYIARPNSILPVVGGASPQTRVPIFSQAKPSLDLSEHDLHHLIDKIKSFDLNMEGDELKASTIERSYATVRLVNSLLSGLDEEPSSKEMALAKTSLIPEVNYFSLPVDLGRYGIERTFGLPQLSPLESEMMDYAIINLNNDLIKAQDLYSSFKPCFEMLRSIVGGSSITKEDGTVLKDHKFETKKKKDYKMKSNKRKRNEPHFRGRKRRANKFPILHCPAPEVVTDKPIEENFGKIERVHKKLQVNQILQERNRDDLPMLKSKEVDDIGQRLSGSNNTDSPLNNVVINDSIVKKSDRINENIDSVHTPLNATEQTNFWIEPFQGHEISKIIDLIDVKNIPKVMHNASKQNFVSINKVENMGVLKDEIEVSKNVKVTIGLKCKINNKNQNEYLQPRTQNQSYRIEMMKSLMLEKRRPHQKENAFSRNNVATKSEIKYFKKKALELKTSNIHQSSNTPIVSNLQNPTGEGSESNNDVILEKQTNLNSNTEELPGLVKVEETTMTPENYSVDEEQYSSLMKNIEEQIGIGISKQNVTKETETKGDQEEILEEKIIATNCYENNCSNPIGNKIDTLKGHDKIHKIKAEQNQKIRKGGFSENNPIVEGLKEVPECCSSEDTNEKTLKEDETHSLRSSEKKESNTQVASAHNNNVSTFDNKAIQINENYVILEENAAENKGEIGIIKDKSESITSNISSEKSNKIESVSLESLKQDEKQNLKTLTSEKSEKNAQLASVNNCNIKNTIFSNTYNKVSELNENNIIPEEIVTTKEGENPMINEKTNCIASDITSEKSNEIEIDQKNLEHSQVKSSVKEVEKQFIKTTVYDVTKKENESINEEIAKQISETAGSVKSEKENAKQKLSFTSGQMLDEGNAVVEIEAQEKLEEMNDLSKRQGNDKLEEIKEKIAASKTLKVGYDQSSEQVNKIREITMQKLKEPLKFLSPLKQEKVAEMVKDKDTKKAEETKKIKDCPLEAQVPENIKVFNYEPKNMHDTRNITNINEIIECLVKSSQPEENSELPSIIQTPFHHIQGYLQRDESKSSKRKVIDLKKKIEYETMEHKRQSKHEKLKKSDQRADAGLKKPPKETPFPFLNKTAKMPDENFDKRTWLKRRMLPDPKEDSPAKVDLKTIDESKALTIYSRNFNESFTKRIQKGNHSNKATDDKKSISYAIGTKTKKDELLKRYTILKTGQICNMVRDDINADELKAKLYKNSLIRAANAASVKQDDKITNMNDSSANDLVKSPPINKEISCNRTPTNILEVKKKVSYNIRKDANNFKDLKKSNNNITTLKNKSFLNLVINRISERSPTLNETSEAIGVRGSHYGSGTYPKSPIQSNEQKIQLQTRKAKDQLNITRFKNNKRMSSELNRGLPTVSNELNQKTQPVTDERDSAKSSKDLTDSMMRSRNKIQLMKEKYQRLKNANLPPKNINIISTPSGANLIKNKDTKKIGYGIKKSITESVKSQSKSNPGPRSPKIKSHSKSNPEPKLEKTTSPPKSNPDSKCENNLIKKDEIVLKPVELPSVEKRGKETILNASEKTKSDPNGPFPDEKVDSLNDININRKEGINSSEISSKNHPTETEEKCSDTSQVIPNPSFTEGNYTTTATNKKLSQENEQGSQDKNGLTKDCIDKQDVPNKIEEVDNIKSGTKQLKVETPSNVAKINKSPDVNVKQSIFIKKGSHDRSQEIGNFKSKENTKEVKNAFHSKHYASSTTSKEKSQQSHVNSDYKTSLMKIRHKNKQKTKSSDEHAALKAVFFSRPTAVDLMKTKQELKTSENERVDHTTVKVPPIKLGMRSVVENKIIPRHSTASSLLLDPDIEKRPSASRKEIPPSLMHAVKPFPTENRDLSKFKTNFYSRWTPQTLKLKENKEGGAHMSNDERIQKNPFVSGKINLTSDLFKAYMKKNRNYEFINPNTDVQFLHQSGQLTSMPQQGVSGSTSRINDQRVAFSTLEANSEKKKPSTSKSIAVIPPFRMQTNSQASISEKSANSFTSLFNKSIRFNQTLKEPPVKGKKILQSSNKAQQPILPGNKPILNKSNEKTNPPFNPFSYKQKDVELKRMHLLKAFQNQESNETKFEKLQINFKKQKSFRKPENALKTHHKEISKDVPNRLQLLNTRSMESIKDATLEDSRRIKKPFSAPADYHPSFPLSKRKKYDKKNKKDESGNTLKKRWTQLLDIFQSVITTEKKNWEQDSPERNLLVSGRSQFTKNAVVPKVKIILRDANHNPDSTAKRVQSYYRKHSVGAPKFQTSYSIDRTNKL